MKINEAEDMEKEIKESFQIVTVGFKLGALNFDFALTVCSSIR